MLVASIANQTNVDCNGNSTGNVTIQVNGGTGPFQYSLDNVNFGPSPTFNGLALGSYTVFVRDGQNCTTNINVNITEPTVLLGSVNNVVDVDCNRNSTGSITVSGSGGTPAYQFSIDGSPFGNSNVFNGLAAGPHSISIRDANNCLFSLNQPISEPPVLASSILIQKNVDCNGNATGAVTIAASGGTAPYQFGINGGALGPDSTFIGLSAGNYTINIEDANGCTRNQLVTITEPSPVAGNIDSQTNADCNGNASGALQISGSGGVAPYQFAIGGGGFQNNGNFTGLAAGNYAITLCD
ncbi:MAG: SprB repeat-containing protein [Bacteroidota bacterium]